jgi:hypothetical protein
MMLSKRGDVMCESFLQGSLLIYDTQVRKYTTGPVMPTARSDLCGAVAGGKFYAAGGYPVNYTSILSTVEVYDIATKTWSKGPGLPEPRYETLGTTRAPSRSKHIRPEG